MLRHAKRLDGFPTPQRFLAPSDVPSVIVRRWAMLGYDTFQL